VAIVEPVGFRGFLFLHAGPETRVSLGRYVRWKVLLQLDRVVGLIEKNLDMGIRDDRRVSHSMQEVFDIREELGPRKCLISVGLHRGEDRASPFD
jgi:hypothetical protein